MHKTKSTSTDLRLQANRVFRVSKATRLRMERRSLRDPNRNRRLSITSQFNKRLSPCSSKPVSIPPFGKIPNPSQKAPNSSNNKNLSNSQRKTRHSHGPLSTSISLKSDRACALSMVQHPMTSLHPKEASRLFQLMKGEHPHALCGRLL